MSNNFFTTPGAPTLFIGLALLILPLAVVWVNKAAVQSITGPALAFYLIFTLGFSGLSGFLLFGLEDRDLARLLGYFFILFANVPTPLWIWLQREGKLKRILGTTAFLIAAYDFYMLFEVVNAFIIWIQ